MVVEFLPHVRDHPQAHEVHQVGLAIIKDRPSGEKEG